MVVLGALNAPGVLRLPISTVATASAANIACAVVMRQELVINALFILFGHCPRWFPLRIRRLSAKIYHLGGVHSGAGVAATIWFGLTNVATFSMNPEAASGGTLIALWTITIALDILLLSILLMALPAFRVRWHDCWEWSQYVPTRSSERLLTYLQPFLWLGCHRTVLGSIPAHLHHRQAYDEPGATPVESHRGFTSVLAAGAHHHLSNRPVAESTESSCQV